MTLLTSMFCTVAPFIGAVKFDASIITLGCWGNLVVEVVSFFRTGQLDTNVRESLVFFPMFATQTEGRSDLADDFLLKGHYSSPDKIMPICLELVVFSSRMTQPDQPKRFWHHFAAWLHALYYTITEKHLLVYRHTFAVAKQFPRPWLLQEAL